jgi:hypothetical protein
VGWEGRVTPLSHDQPEHLYMKLLELSRLFCKVQGIFSFLFLGRHRKFAKPRSTSVRNARDDCRYRLRASVCVLHRQKVRCFCESKYFVERKVTK